MYHHIFRNHTDTHTTCTLSRLGRFTPKQRIIKMPLIQQPLFFGINYQQILFSGLISTPSFLDSFKEGVCQNFKHCFFNLLLNLTLYKHNHLLIILTILLSHLLESSFYSCTDSATAHNTRERVLQYKKIDRLLSTYEGWDLSS